MAKTTDSNPPDRGVDKGAPAVVTNTKEPPQPAGGASPPADTAPQTVVKEKSFRDALFADKLLISLGLIFFICLFIYLIIAALIATSSESYAGRVGFVVVAVVILTTFILWKAPKRQVSFAKSLSPKEAFELENEARKTLAQILGGIFLLVGVYGTLRSMQISEDAQFAGRLDKALEQLNNEKPHARSGAIMVLQSLADESGTYGPGVREMLAEYIRDTVPYNKPAPGSGTPQAAPSSAAGVAPPPQPGLEISAENIRRDIQRLIKYLGKPLAGPREPVNLNTTDLHAIDFQLCRCDRWVFKDSYLENARFRSSRLHSADFRNSILRGADFHEAELLSVDFSGADLSGARLDFAKNLSTANFTNATLTGVSFTGVDLTDVDLSNARGLELKQIVEAVGVRRAKLPTTLEEELKRKYPPPPPSP